jgi:hypothetical protein
MKADILSDLSFYRAARFRPGVLTDVTSEAARVSYRELNLDLEHSSNAEEPLSRLFADLNDGVPIEGLEGRLGPFFEPALEVLSALDRYGLLDEAAPRAPDAYLTGAQLWREVDALAKRMSHAPVDGLTVSLVDGSAARDQLVRYAREYFHIVRMGSRIAASALANTRLELVPALEAFLSGELGHDRMLAASLSAVELDPKEVAASNPLPETFAVITALQVMADQEPLSYAASLFLVERANPEFHEAFVACCGRHKLPDRFWRPILRHAGLNDEGDHGGISQELLELIPVVSDEEATGVKKQVIHLIDALVDLDLALADTDER